MWFAVFCLLLPWTVNGQSCSYVTVPVCDHDVTVTPGQLGGVRGMKGDAGPPGKSGAVGLKGQKGGRGEPENFEEFKEEIRCRFQALEDSMRPASCMTSSVHGRQMLRDGEEAFCDNGWTVFQRRFDGSTDFLLNWANYSNGFGNLSGEFWLGLNKLHQLTHRKGCKLRVDLWDFDETYAYAQYSLFSVEDESDNYRLHLSGYSGTAGDSMDYHNGMQFSSADRDNDMAADHCVFRHNSGSFWYKSCFSASLNAPWGRSTKAWDRIVWDEWKGSKEALKAVNMKLRCCSTLCITGFVATVSTSLVMLMTYAII